MAVAKTMNATVVTGTYTNSQGEEKKSYLNIGTLFIYDDGGMSLKLDAMPLGGQNISFYDKKPKEQQSHQNYQQNQGYGTQQQPQMQYQDNNGNNMSQEQYNNNMNNYQQR